VIFKDKNLRFKLDIYFNNFGMEIFSWTESSSKHE